MRTQTKCTLGLGFMFIVEILPLPFTALLGIYVIRKRPEWFPKVVENLYADKNDDMEAASETLKQEKSPKEYKTRKRCTMTMMTLTFFDLAIPVTIPFGLYIVRRRPTWFREVVVRLYNDPVEQKDAMPSAEAATASERPPQPVETAAHRVELEKRIQEIKQENLDFARAFVEGNLGKESRKARRQRGAVSWKQLEYSRLNG